MGFGETSLRRNGPSAKWPFGEMSLRRNIPSAKYTFGEMASAKWVSAKWLSAKCPDTGRTNNYAFTYDFTVPDQASTYWYHSHALTQYVDGVVGALIIHDPDDPYLNEYDEEIIVMLTDYHHTMTQ
ncbi:unnamed protein product [Rhizophagus irregularis]|nr:unnamed protein product [Rhizophagus irregularis]